MQTFPQHIFYESSKCQKLIIPLPLQFVMLWIWTCKCKCKCKAKVSVLLVSFVSLRMCEYAYPVEIPAGLRRLWRCSRGFSISRILRLSRTQSVFYFILVHLSKIFFFLFLSCNNLCLLLFHYLRVALVSLVKIKHSYPSFYLNNNNTLLHSMHVF